MSQHWSQQYEKKFKPSLAIACDVLDENDGLKNGYKAGEIPLAPENTTAVTAVAPLLAANATRVHAAREAQDLLEAVKVTINDTNIPKVELMHILTDSIPMLIL